LTPKLALFSADPNRIPAGTTFSTYTIIRTAANSLMAPIHDRMPVILRQDDEMRWLSRAVLPAEELHRIFAPYPVEAMEAYPVSERVNSSVVDDNGVIERGRGL
jgi:putative SOS response-associated peptidase YedK